MSALPSSFSFRTVAEKTACNTDDRSVLLRYFTSFTPPIFIKSNIMKCAKELLLSTGNVTRHRKQKYM